MRPFICCVFLRQTHFQIGCFRCTTKVAATKFKYKVGEQLEELERDEGLAMLMPDIQLTATLVCEATDKLIGSECDNYKDSAMDGPLSISPEEQYLKVMKQLQFGE